MGSLFCFLIFFFVNSQSILYPIYMDNQHIKKTKSICLISLCLFMIFLTGLPSYAKNTGYTYQDGFLEGGAWEYDKAEEKIDIPGEEKINGKEILGKNKKTKKKKKATKNFDPRKTGSVTSIKCQGDTGLCWAFSAIATAESSLIRSGLADSSINLSELHLAYFGWLSYKEETGSDIGFLAFCKEGAFMQAYDLFKEGTGPVYDDPDKLEIELTNDFSMPEEYDKKHDFTLKCIANIDMSDISAVKEAVKNYGGVNAYYYSGTYFYMDMVNEWKDTSYYRGNSGKLKPPDHAVEVVGWDDHFPKESFAYSPQKDGAWLCKNSWGDCGYYQEYGSGYYWISYYEPTLYVFEGKALAFEQNDINDTCKPIIEIDDGEVSVINLTKTDAKTVEIPSEISVNGKKYPVTQIEDIVFKGNTDIETVVIGDYVKEIEPEAFKGCTNLKKVTLGSSLEDIGFDAFRGCVSLEKIKVPDSVQLVEERAFMDCTGLSEAYMGKGLLDIGFKAFYGCRSLKKVTIKSKTLWGIGKNAFYGTKKIKFKVPKSCKQRYKKLYGI